jgi:hypothetical protein
MPLTQFNSENTNNGDNNASHWRAAVDPETTDAQPRPQQDFPEVIGVLD